MNQPSIRTVVALAIAAFSVYLAIYYWPNIAGFIGLILQAVAPLVYGAVLAYPLNILMSFYERHMLPKSSSRVVARVRPGLSLVAALLTLVAVVAIVLQVATQVLAAVLPVITQIIEAITPLPQGDVTLAEMKAGLGDEVFLIDGIPEVFDRCFARDQLPEEIGVVWR